MNYEELVKALRSASTVSTAWEKLMHDAAAAIEELQALLTEADKKQAYQHDCICELTAENEELKAKDYWKEACEYKAQLPKRGEWNNHEVACLLAEMFGDNCACNLNGIDEWLPKYCEFAETCCPNPVGVACWEQFLKHRAKMEVQE